MSTQVLEAAGLVAVLCALGFVKRSPRAVTGAARPILFALLGFLALSHLANLLEWTGHSWADAAADHLSIAVPLLWGLFLLEIGRSYLSAQIAAGTEQLRFYLEKVPAAVACLTGEGKLEAFSRAWARIAPESELGRSLFDVLPVELPRLRDAARQCAEDGKESHADEESARDASGKPRYFRWGLRCFQHPDHDRPLIMLMLEELTADVEAEAQRAEASEELARAERMAHLGQLAAGAAHDFNNLLQVMHAAAYELTASPGDAEALNDLNRALSTAGEMTKSMLQFGRAGGDTQGAVDLRALVTELERLVSHTLGRRHRFVATVTDQPLVVQGNATRLQQAVLNLVTNARDAMPEGGQIEVTLSQRNGDALLEVHDSGIGMTEAVRKQLFKPFFTTKETRGTGLGLAMVRKTVEEHRGQVSVESEPGAGTTFRLRIPLRARATTNVE